MAVAYVNSGAAASGTTSAAIPQPATPASGAIFVAHVGCKPFGSTPSTPAGFTQRATGTSGSVANGVSTGSVRATSFTHDATGAETGSVSFAVASGSPTIGRMQQFSKAAGATFAVAATVLADTTETGTAVSATGTSIPIAAGDMLSICVVLKDDALTHTAQVLTVPGCTLSAVTWDTQDTTTTGNDASIYLGRCSVTAGTSTGAPTYTATSSVSGASATAVSIVRLRELPTVTMTPAAMTLAAQPVAIIGAWRAAVTADGPVGWWRLDEASGTVAADSAGTNTGTYFGSPTMGVAKLTPYDPTGTAITLASTLVQGVNVPDAAALNPASISVEALIDPTSWPSNNRIVQKGASDNQYRLTREGSSLIWHLTGLATVSIATPDTNRHHLVGTYDQATGIARLYVDGREAASASTTAGTALPVTTDILTIGNKPGSGFPGDGLNGTIDEVALYNYALTANQVAAHARAVGFGSPILGRVIVTAAARAVIYASSDRWANTWLDLWGAPEPLTAQVDDNTGLTDAGVRDAAAATGTDLLALTDDLTVDLTRVGLSVTVTDSAGLVDAATTAAGFARAVTDPAGAVDSTVQAWSLVSTDSAGLADTTAKLTAVQADDPTGLADSQAFGVGRAVTDSAGLADTATPAKAGSQTYTVDDPAGSVDSLTFDVARAVTDAAGTTDTATAGLVYARALTDPAGPGDTFALGYGRAITDDTGSTDSWQVTASWVRAVTDPAGMVDAQGMDVGRVVADTAGLVDTATPNTFTTLAVTVNDTLGLADATSLVGQWARRVDDSAGVVDALALLGQWVRALTDTTGLSDAALLEAARRINELLALTDDLSLVQFTGRQITTRPNLGRTARVLVGATTRPATGRTARDATSGRWANTWLDLWGAPTGTTPRPYTGRTPSL